MSSIDNGGTEVVYASQAYVTAAVAAGGGGGSSSLTDVIRSTDGNLSAAVNTWYHWDISGLTAQRTLTLPSTAEVGDRVALRITTGDDTYRVVITAASGDTLDGIAGGTGWSGLFISGEVVIMRCIVANTTWIVEFDGRIPCRHRLYRLGNSSDLPLAASAWSTLTFTHEEIGRGNIGNLGSNQIVMRRSGFVTVNVTGAVAQLNTAVNPTLIAVAANIGGTRYEFARDTWTTTTSSVAIANNTITKEVQFNTVIYAEMAQYQADPRNVSSFAYLEVIEQL